MLEGIPYLVGVELYIFDSSEVGLVLVDVLKVVWFEDEAQVAEVDHRFDPCEPSCLNFEELAFFKGFNALRLSHG